MSWRPATPNDDDAIVSMCLALNAEDPGPLPVPTDHMRRTLDVLRKKPDRGRALVLESEGAQIGYALLIAFWSNELGGEVCEIDELYVEPTHRGRGHATELIRDLARKSVRSFEGIVALALETTPANVHARRLYARLGFQDVGVSMCLRLPG
jgi:GNAT superfamily N-acetyltransferase